MLRRTTTTLFGGISTIGAAHPDVQWGNMQAQYRGPGWVGYFKVMPIEALMMQGGGSCTNLADRVGQLLDPEDPRHPMATFCVGGNTHHDGSTAKMVEGNDFGKIPESSRLLQSLYDAYLEPFSMHRNAVPLEDGARSPNHWKFNGSVDGCGGTSTIIGGVVVGWGSTIGENCTLKGDVNDIMIQEGVQIMDNVCIVTDRPTTLHHYQRNEDLNPYQTVNLIEGIASVQMHSVIEPNVFLDSCQLGKFNRIGHGSHIMKGATSGDFVHVMPGSVVAANTRMGDYELWGGAPAKKLGKVAKFETKRVFGAANLVRDMVYFANQGLSTTGDQNTLRLIKDRELQTLMVQYEDHVSPSLKAKIESFVEGREPWHHMITRITQGWQPSVRTDDRNFLVAPPLSQFNNYASHNCDSFDSQWHGSRMNLTNYHSEFQW